VVAGLFEGTAYRLDSDELFGLLGYFLLVLIGLELLETIKAYLNKREFHVEIIVLVARKVILLDTTTAGELIGIALIIIALCGGYYLIRRAGPPRSFPPPGREEP